MKYMALLLLAALPALGQRDLHDSNRIGIGGGVNQFTLKTDNFKTAPGAGWQAGLSMRGNFYNDFDMVYGIQFSENHFTVETMAGPVKKDVDYTIPSAQLSLLLSYKFIENHLSLEFGPMLQVSGKMKLDKSDEENSVTGTDLLAKDIAETSRFNLFPTIGITAGVKHVRLNVMYQYGITNLLGALNKNDLGVNFKGNAGILSGSVIVYL